MARVDIQVNQLDVERLSKALERIQRHTGRSAGQAVGYAMVKICESGRADSKPGKKKRKIIPDQFVRRWARKSGDESGRLAGYVEVLHQRKPKRLVRVTGSSDPKTMIPRHGFAKKLWNIMAAKAAAMKNGDADSRRQWFRVNKRTRQDVTEGLVHNRLTYLDKAYPGQEARIVIKGSMALEREVDRQLGIILKEFAA